MNEPKSTPPPAAPPAPTKPSPWAPSDADRCEASPVSYQAKKNGQDTVPIAERCRRVWLVRVGGKKLCRSCAVLATEATP